MATKKAPREPIPITLVLNYRGSNGKYSALDGKTIELTDLTPELYQRALTRAGVPQTLQPEVDDGAEIKAGAVIQVRLVEASE